MKSHITIYQKPTCTKCRTALHILRETGLDFQAINYYERPFTAAGLRSVLKKLKLTPEEILRKDEPVARRLGIGKKNYTEPELIALMVGNPDLIQRPIVVRGDAAVLGRPPENIQKLLS